MMAAAAAAAVVVVVLVVVVVVVVTQLHDVTAQYSENTSVGTVSHMRKGLPVHFMLH
jgi:hypothetical protein